MRRALLALCCAMLVVVRAGEPRAVAPPHPTHRTYRAPVEAPCGIRSGPRPAPSAPATGASSTPPRRAPSSGRRPRAGDLRRRGRRFAPRHGPAPRRRPHQLLVPRPHRRGGGPGGRPGGRRRADRRRPPLRRPPRRRLLRPVLAVRARAATVRLVPFDEPPGEGAAGEQSALRQLVGGIGDLVGGGVGTVAHWLREGSTQTLMGLAHYGERFTFPGFFLDAALTGWQAWQRARATARRPCTGDAVVAPVPLERRVALLVGASDPPASGPRSTASTPPRSATTGRRRAAVQLRGRPRPRRHRRVPRRARPRLRRGRPPRATSAPRPAGSPTSSTAVAAEAPDVPIDLVAHSQGGVVARLALIELEARHGPGGWTRIGIVATLGTPHGGADLATAADVVGVTRSATRPSTPSGPSPGSTPTRPRSGSSPRPPTSPPSWPDDPCPTAFGPCRSPLGATSSSRCLERGARDGRGDRARHGRRQPTTSSPRHAATTRELSLALAGLPPGCRSIGQALLDQGVGEGISLVDGPGGGRGVPARRRGGRAHRLIAPLASPTGQATA